MSKVDADTPCSAARLSNSGATAEVILIHCADASVTSVIGSIGIEPDTAMQTYGEYSLRIRLEGGESMGSLRGAAQRPAGVLDGRRVSPRRGKGLLTADEAGQVRRWIADQTPDQLKLPFAEYYSCV